MNYPDKKTFGDMLIRVMTAAPEMAVLSQQEMQWLRTWLDDDRVTISSGPGVPDARKHFEKVLAWNELRLKSEGKQLGRPASAIVSKRRNRVFELRRAKKGTKEIVTILKKEKLIPPDKRMESARAIVRTDSKRTKTAPKL